MKWDMAGKETNKICCKSSQHLPGATILLCLPSSCLWVEMQQQPCGRSQHPTWHLFQSKTSPLGRSSSRKGKISKRCCVGSLPCLCLHGSFRNVSGTYSVVSPRTLIYKHSPLSWLALDYSWGCLSSLLLFMQPNVYRKALMATSFFLLPLVGPVNIRWCRPASPQIQQFWELGALPPLLLFCGPWDRPSPRLDRQLPEPASAHKQKHNQELNPFYTKHIGIN